MVAPPLRDLLARTATAGVLTTGALCALRAATRPPPLPECILSYGAFGRRYPALAQALVGFSRIGEPEAFDGACRAVAQIAELERNMDPSSMWKISRLAAQVEHALAQALARALVRPDTYVEAMYCQTDAMDAVKGCLDAIVHNHLFDYESVSSIR